MITKLSQPRASLSDALVEEDLEQSTARAHAVKIDVSQNEREAPEHRHRKGQLVMASRGGVTCRVPSGMWMVPPQCGVWVPGGMLHSNVATANARLFFLFIEPGTADLPDRCCTLSLSPLVRELIIEMAESVVAGAYAETMTTLLLAALPKMPVEDLHLPLTAEPRLDRIASALVEDPSDRSTMRQWAKRVAMSENSLARLVQQETGLTFGRWRQQLQLIIAIRSLASGATVQKVSADLGYESVSAFITMFKKALGASPSKYLRNFDR
ncbi:helix-turn-helix transcriptional regulator [Rhizobium sp. P40RR-XXII]|uniref:AraC family transcriptional regulator n=1 Tax=Rhizobium sp. P40RR-XXII TaxID=2726739 RepID=UPI0014576392|nr:helix-turn-helix transcriptional regulator [Rhizobium sp. P40RR-XXII]NLS18596.1 helix-turn-helix transcriptional regulator [Rhizobium sp. P40RR-XXII]